MFTCPSVTVLLYAGDVTDIDRFDLERILLAPLEVVVEFIIQLHPARGSAPGTQRDVHVSVRSGAIRVTSEHVDDVFDI